MAFFRNLFENLPHIILRIIATLFLVYSLIYLPIGLLLYLLGVELETIRWILFAVMFMAIVLWDVIGPWFVRLVSYSAGPYFPNGLFGRPDEEDKDK